MTNRRQGSKSTFEELESLLISIKNTSPLKHEWTQNPIVILGAGSFGRNLARTLKDNNINVAGFMDRRGVSTVDNLPCYSIHDEDVSKWKKAGYSVIIGILNYAHSISDAVTQVINLGFCRVITPMECYEFLGKQLGEHFWLSRRELIGLHCTDIFKVFELLVDDMSKNGFLEILRFRYLYDLNTCLNPDTEKQYFPDNLPQLPQPLYFLDGGAYIGDTIQTLIAHNQIFAQIYAFEPDTENFKRLLLQTSDLSNHIPVKLLQCGLWSSKTVVSFNDGLGAGSKISDDNKLKVTLVTIDDIVGNNQCNFIKLDIEGAELDALEGAKRTIQKFRPRLAICCYHKPDHLWKIPIWINNLNLNYKLYLRNHQYNTFETVIYAI